MTDAVVEPCEGQEQPEPQSSAEQIEDPGDGEALGWLAKVLAIPLTPGVVAWDGGKAVLTRAIPAVVSQVVSWVRWVIGQCGHLTGLLLGVLGRTIVRPLKSLLSVFREVLVVSLRLTTRLLNDLGTRAQGLVKLLTRPALAVWIAFRGVTRRVWIAVRGVTRRVWIAVRGVTRRVWIAVRGFFRGGLQGARGLWTRLSVVARQLASVLVRTVRLIWSRLTVPLRNVSRLLLRGVVGWWRRFTSLSRLLGRPLLRGLQHSWVRLEAAIRSLVGLLRSVSAMLRTRAQRVFERIFQLLERVGHPVLYALRQAFKMLGKLVRASALGLSKIGGQITVWTRRVLANVRNGIQSVTGALLRPLRRTAYFGWRVATTLVRSLGSVFSRVFHAARVWLSRLGRLFGRFSQWVSMVVLRPLRRIARACRSVLKRTGSLLLSGRRRLAKTTSPVRPQISAVRASASRLRQELRMSTQRTTAQLRLALRRGAKR